MLHAWLPRPYIRPVRIPFSPLIRELRLRHRWLWLVSSREPLYFLHPAAEVVHIEGARKSPAPIRISQTRYVFVWSIHCSLNEVKHLHAPSTIPSRTVNALPDVDGASRGGTHGAQAVVESKYRLPNAATVNPSSFLHHVEQQGVRLLRRHKRVEAVSPLASKGRWMAAHSLRYPYLFQGLKRALFGGSVSFSQPTEPPLNLFDTVSVKSLFPDRSGNTYEMVKGCGDDAARVFAAGVATAVAREKKNDGPGAPRMQANYGKPRWRPTSFLRQLIRQESPFVSLREGRHALAELSLVFPSVSEGTEGQARSAFLASWFPLAAYGRFSRYGNAIEKNRKGVTGVDFPFLSAFTHRLLVTRTAGGADGRNASSPSVRSGSPFGSGGDSFAWNTPALAQGFGVHPGIHAIKPYMSLSPVRPLAGQLDGDKGTLAFAEGRRARAGSIVPGRSILLTRTRAMIRSGGDSISPSQLVSRYGPDYANNVGIAQWGARSPRSAPDKRDVASSGPVHAFVAGEAAKATLKALIRAPQASRGSISAQHSAPEAPRTAMDHAGNVTPDFPSKGRLTQHERGKGPGPAHGHVIQGRARPLASADAGSDAVESLPWHPAHGFRDEAGSRSTPSPYASRTSAVPETRASQTLFHDTRTYADRTTTRHVVSHIYHAVQAHSLSHTRTRFVGKSIKPLRVRGVKSARFTAMRPIHWIRPVLHSEGQREPGKMPLFQHSDYSYALPDVPPSKPPTARVLKMRFPLVDVIEEPLVQKVPYGDSNGLVHLQPQIVQRIVAGESTTTQINPAVIRANNPVGIADLPPQPESYVATDAGFSADAVAEKVLSQLGKRLGNRQLNRFADLIFERVVRRINLEKDRLGIR